MSLFKLSPLLSLLVGLGICQGSLFLLHAEEPDTREQFKTCYLDVLETLQYSKSFWIEMKSRGYASRIQDGPRRPKLSTLENLPSVEVKNGKRATEIQVFATAFCLEFLPKAREFYELPSFPNLGSRQQEYSPLERLFLSRFDQLKENSFDGEREPLSYFLATEASRNFPQWRDQVIQIKYHSVRKFLLQHIEDSDHFFSEEEQSIMIQALRRSPKRVKPTSGLSPSNVSAWVHSGDHLRIDSHLSFKRLLQIVIHEQVHLSPKATALREKALDELSPEELIELALYDEFRASYFENRLTESFNEINESFIPSPRLLVFEDFLEELVSQKALYPPLKEALILLREEWMEYSHTERQEHLFEVLYSRPFFPTRSE